MPSSAQPLLSGSINEEPQSKSRPKLIIFILLIITIISLAIAFHSDISQAFAVCPAGSLGCKCDSAAKEPCTVGVCSLDHCINSTAKAGSLGAPCDKNSCDSGVFPIKKHGKCVCTGRTGALEAWLASAGVAAPLVFGAVYIGATVTLLPASVLTVASGVLFPLGTAFVTVYVSANIGATLAFLLSRFLAREYVLRTAVSYPKFGAIDQAIARQNWLVLLLRLSPAIPFNALNYFLGVTGVPLWRSVVYSAIGMAPGTFMFVYLGWATRGAVASAASNNSGSNVAKDVLIYGVGSVATIAAVVAVTVIARRAVTRIIAENEPAEGDPDGESAHLKGEDPSQPVQVGSLLPAPRQGDPSFPADVARVCNEVRQVLDRAPEKTALFKDIPRLAARTVVQDGTGRDVYDGTGSVSKLVLAIARLAEQDAETAAALGKELSQALEAPDVRTQQALQQVLLDSRFRRTLAAIRAIHQGILMPVTKWLKMKTRLQTKDVSGPLGWRVRVERNGVADHITVRHYRREESYGSSEHTYWLEYLISVTMDVARNKVETVHVSFPEHQTDSPLVRPVLSVLDNWNVQSQ